MSSGPGRLPGAIPRSMALLQPLSVLMPVAPVATFESSEDRAA